MFGFGKQRENDRMAQVIQGRLDALAHRPESQMDAPEVAGVMPVEDAAREFEEVLKAG